MRRSLPLPCAFLTAGAGLLAFWALAEHGAEPAASPFSGRKVLVVGIDGLRADAVLAAEAPNLQAIQRNGAFTFRAFAGGIPDTPTFQPTVSGPGWSSILTGVWLDKHKVSDNSFSGANYTRYPHFFQRIKEREPRASLSSIASWNPIDEIIVGAVGNAADFRGKGIGPSYQIRDASVRDQAVQHLRSADPDVLFLHFDQVDGAGHASGFTPLNPKYLQAVAQVDAYVGDVLEAIRERPQAEEEDWLIVVTSDHGGQGTSHGGQTNAERSIPFFVSGGRARRGEGPPVVGHTAVPPTVLQHLGIPVDPAWGWDSEAFGLPPFAPSDLVARAEPDRSVALRWQPAVEFPAHGLELLRNGRLVTTLPLESREFIDRPPTELGVESRVRYVLRITGSAQQTAPLTAEAVLPPGPRDALVLDLDLGEGATDRSEAGNHGTLQGEPERVTGPSRSGALKFGGSSNEPQRVTVADGDSLRFGRFTSFTVALWTQGSTEAAPGTPLLEAREPEPGSPLRPGWALSAGRDGGWQWSAADGASRAAYESPPHTIDDGRWHHLAAVHERSGDARLYLDGALVATADLTRLRELDADQGLSLGGDGSATFQGALAEPRIWRRALTESEVIQLHRSVAAYPAWQEAVFTEAERADPALSGASSDADTDGWTVSQEFAFGRNPLEADPGPPPLRIASRDDRVEIRVLLRGGGVGYPGADYRADGVFYALEMLGEREGRWLPAEGFALDHLTPEEDGMREAVFLSDRPVDELASGLFRLRTVLER